MARPPTRNKQVYFLGAGFSRAAGLPNTAELLTQVHALAATHTSWGVSKKIDERLEAAYAYFYPDRGTGFRPDVVDFFSVLTTYGAIDRGGLPDGFGDRALLADLRFAIAQILCQRTKALDEVSLRTASPDLDQMIQPGNVVITSNWDGVVERLCEARGVKLKLSGGPDNSHLLLLKLHGSVDWVKRADAKKAPVTKTTYASLAELMNSTRAHRLSVAGKQVLRVRVDRAGASWQRIKGAVKAPLMITMAPGKADALEPLLDIWEAAYRSLSGAAALHIVGYSIPPDDVEIRTLLRAGIVRGPTDARVVVRNPAPDVHVRARQLLERGLESDYRSVDRFG